MKLFAKNLVVLASLSSLVACSPGQNTTNQGIRTLNSAAIVADETLTPTEKAEKLALAGEQLTTPTGFMYADFVFDQALSIDPNNQRAQFYKALLATPMALKGIMARIKPLADRDAKSQKEYNDALQNLPNHGLKTFLLDGQPDIKNEKGVQDFLTQIYQGQNQLREFLKKNKSMELTLNLNDWAIPGAIQRSMEECAIEQVEQGVYEIQLCPMNEVLQMKMNRADIEMLQHFTAGMQIYLATLVSYDFTGVVATSIKHEGKQSSARAFYKDLALVPDFGKLRNAQALKNIVPMGIDAVAGVRWALQIQHELCPYGENNHKNRRGFLFREGLCIKAENEDGTLLEDTLKIVDSVLLGQPQAVNLGQYGEIRTVIKPTAPLLNPIMDLKTLRPVFSPCNTIQAVSDDTLGGLFPNKDANEVLASQAQCNPWDQ